MTVIMGGLREAKIGGHRLQVPGDPLRRGEVQLGQGAKGIGIVVNETEAGAPDEGVIDGETVLNGELLDGAKRIEPDDMVGSRKVKMMNNGTARGRLHAVLVRSSDRTGRRKRWDRSRNGASPSIEPYDSWRPFRSKGDGLSSRRSESVPVWVRQDGSVSSR